MGSKKPSNKNPKPKRKLPASAAKNPKFKPKKHSKSYKDNKSKIETQNDNDSNVETTTRIVSTAEQLSFFFNQFQSSNGIQLSSLETESINESCIVELSPELGQDAEHLGQHLKSAFGPKWKETLCEEKLVEGEIDAGCPGVLIVSTSAIRSLELLRGVRELTKECNAAKLFSKHIKVEEQVSLLKKRVNIAAGTPNRIKKLIDMEAMGLSRLSILVIDMQTDVKGYSLLTLPQVRDEFWDLYKTYFHQLLLQGDLRIFLYGMIPINADRKGKS